MRNDAVTITNCKNTEDRADGINNGDDDKYQSREDKWY